MLQVESNGQEYACWGLAGEALSSSCQCCTHDPSFSTDELWKESPDSLNLHLSPGTTAYKLLLLSASVSPSIKRG